MVSYILDMILNQPLVNNYMNQPLVNNYIDLNKIIHIGAEAKRIQK